MEKTPSCIVNEERTLGISTLGGSEWLWYLSVRIRYAPDLSPTEYHVFKHLYNFFQGKKFHNQQEAENPSQEFIKSWSMDFFFWWLFLGYFFLKKKSELQKALEWLCSLQGPQSNKKHS